MQYVLIFFFMLFSWTVQSLTLLPDYPKVYTVQPGDTLWSIASKYLEQPWDWRALWRANPFIKNPSRLYPGAVLELRFYQQRPYIRVLSNGTLKLSPNMRPLPLERAILPIPLMDIKPFLNASLVMDQDRLQNAPYIVALMGEHMLGGQGDEVYVENLHPRTDLPGGTTISYAIYRPGCPYYEPETQRLLGYKASLVGYGQLVRPGEPSVVLLTEITAGIKLKDRVMLNDFPEFKLYFEPKTPRGQVEGKIIEMPPDNYTQGAVGLVAIIDRGQDKGLEAGDVLAIYSPPRVVPDPLHQGKPVLIPRERVGELMIFRTFSKTSFALVVRSTRAVHLLDIVTNP